MHSAVITSLFDISNAHVNAHGTECPARVQGARTTSSISNLVLRLSLIERGTQNSSSVSGHC